MISRRGYSLPANASDFDPHRSSIRGRFGQVRLLQEALTLDPDNAAIHAADVQAEKEVRVGKLRAVSEVD